MCHIVVCPVDHDRASVEIIAPNMNAVPQIVCELTGKEADVHRDGRYAFSIRVSDSGVWSIVQSRKVTVAEREPASA